MIRDTDVYMVNSIMLYRVHLPKQMRFSHRKLCQMPTVAAGYVRRVHGKLIGNSGLGLHVFRITRCANRCTGGERRERGYITNKLFDKHESLYGHGWFSCTAYKILYYINNIIVIFRVHRIM